MVSKYRVKNIYEEFSNLEKEFSLFKEALSKEEEQTRKNCETSLYFYVKTFWPILYPAFDYVDGWHIKAICDHLEAAYRGEITRLIINIPSRCMKSTICNIFFPSWVWAKEANLKFLNISGDYSLALRDNVKCRQLIQSDLYQRFWGHKVEISKDCNTKERYANTAGGEKLIKTIQGSAMGEGAHLVIVDDGNSSQDIFSTVRREYTNEVIDSTVSVRIDKVASDRSGSLIIIQQRLHEYDLSGHWLAKNDPAVVHLMLPMEFELKRKCSTVTLCGTKTTWEDPRTEEGELLWPEMFDEDSVETRKIGYGSAITIQAQMQQNPTPAGGNIIKREWFMPWKFKQMPHCEYVISSWDTALSTGEDACESAITTWGIFKNDMGFYNIILLNCWSGKLATPDLRKMIKKCAYNYYTFSHTAPDRMGPEPDLILIEKAANGQALIDDLRRGGLLKVIGFDPKNHGFKTENGVSPTSKVARTHYASMMIEQGLVWIPMSPTGQYSKPYLFAEKFIEACLRYPRGTGKDILDSMSQAFIYMRKSGLLHHKGEEPEVDYVNITNQHLLYREERV